MNPFGLYIHWPWCLSKCAYCDFNSRPLANIDEKQWLAAYLADIGHLAGLMPGRTVSSVFFGGGTPSLMPPAVLDGILAAIAGHWALADDREISLEANPGATGNFPAITRAGINRLSLGIQSLDDTHLNFLGRRHSAREGLEALEEARKDFSRVSADFITALPGQSLAMWEKELSAILALGLSHLSIYQLTLEAGTRLAALNPAMPDEDKAAANYELTAKMTGEAGLCAYEVSNHAKPGEECRHNLLYWRYGDYGGIGPGAHGRLTLPGGKLATTFPAGAEAWMKKAGAPDTETLDARAQTTEMLLMGLRLAEGVNLARLAALGWPDVATNSRIQSLMEQGFLERTDSHLRTTPAGRLRLNGVIERLA